MPDVWHPGAPCGGSVLSSLSLGFIDQVGAEAELLCHFTGSCLDGCKVYHKSILLRGRLATKSITEQESTHAIRRARKKEGKNLALGSKEITELQPDLSNTLLVFFHILFFMPCQLTQHHDEDSY